MQTLRSTAVLAAAIATLAASTQAHAQRRVQQRAAPERAQPAETQPEPGAEPAAMTDPAAEPDAASSVPASAAPASQASALPPSPPAAPAGSEPSEAERAELAALQAELSQVMDDLVQARARVAVLGKSLFKTRVRVKLDNRAAPDQQAARIGLWLDGAPIFSGDGAAVRDPERALWEGFAAPGAHVLTLEVEQRAQDDDSYRYTLRESFRFVVVRERRTDLRVVLDDDSDMAEDFPDDREGAYEVQTRLEARAVELDDD
jgi:hypothetical protein